MTDAFAQFMHDISNIVQNMMIASYERQIGGTNMVKIDKGISDLKRSIEIYRCCFFEVLNYAKFEQIVEDISLLHGREIELEEDGEPLESILEILCVYCIWIAKNEEISSISVSEKKAYIQTKNPKNLEFYTRNSDLKLKSIIDKISKSANIIIYHDEKDSRIYLESKPFTI